MTENKFDHIRVVDVGPITKALLMTDAHYGARNNSDQHNQDNGRYIDWFIDHCKKEKASHVFFLGDWFENRNQVSVKTLNYSLQDARKLNALGIPIIFIIGNHDLYLRNSRDIFSTNVFADLENFVIVSEPMYLGNDKKYLVSPYLFKDEYPQLAAAINAATYVFGHFEFRDFVVTGADRRMEHGPDADAFSGPKYIFSGHFHKRQANKNIIYIGNIFPTNYGDAGDAERGLAILDSDDDVSFLDWEDAPLYFKMRLSQILSEGTEFPKGSRVRCIMDVDVAYSEVQELREEMMRTYELREFTVEIDNAARQEMVSDGMEIDSEISLATLDNTVRQLIGEGVTSSANIDPNMLIELYDSL